MAKPDPTGGGFIIEDRAGKRVGRLEPDANGYIIRDDREQPIGHIEYDSAREQWEVDLRGGNEPLASGS